MNFSATARDLSHQGLGVVDHPDGRVFFVPGVWPGDAGDFEIISEKKRYGFAKLINLTEPSADRVAVPCPYQGFTDNKCGGCAWMIANYDSQWRYKEHMVRHSFARAGMDTEISAILPSPQTSHYRNRAQLKTNGKEIGFVAAQSNQLVDVESCLVLNNKCNAILKSLRTKLPQKDWEPSADHAWNFIDIDDAQDPTQLTLNQRLPFRQGNPEQNLKMKNWFFEQISNEKYSSALELFCGSGNFTEGLVRAGFQNILALDVNATAIKGLKQKNWPAVTSQRCDLYRENPKKILKEFGLVDVLVLDPPRDGFASLKTWASEIKGLQKIIYLSCATQSLIRDIHPLTKINWQVTSVQPIDLFPHTPHIEVLCGLERKT